MCVHACVCVYALSLWMCVHTHDRAITAAQGSLLEAESTAINQSAFRWLWHEKRVWPLLTLGVSPNLLYLPTQEWLSVCEEGDIGREREWWIGMEMSKLTSGSNIEKGRREALGLLGRWIGEGGRVGGWVMWVGVEWREGDVGRGLQVVFAKLKGQQLEPIC